MRRFAFLLLMLLAVGGALTLTALLHPFTGKALASTLGMGLGLALAVYVDRRWVRPVRAPAWEAVSLGAATALGWGVAQVLAGVV